MTQHFTQQECTRDNFGALSDFSDEASAVFDELFDKALESRKIAAPYDRTYWHKRHGKLGWLLSYDIYDVTPTAILVQRRETECTKYGNQPHKRYFIIRRCGRGTVVTEAPKHRVMKLAKASDKLGQVIATLTKRA